MRRCVRAGRQTLRPECAFTRLPYAAAVVNVALPVNIRVTIHAWTR